MRRNLVFTAIASLALFSSFGCSGGSTESASDAQKSVGRITPTRAGTFALFVNCSVVPESLDDTLGEHYSGTYQERVSRSESFQRLSIVKHVEDLNVIKRYRIEQLILKQDGSGEIRLTDLDLKIKETLMWTITGPQESNGSKPANIKIPQEKKASNCSIWNTQNLCKELGCNCLTKAQA